MNKIYLIILSVITTIFSLSTVFIPSAQAQNLVSEIPDWFLSPPKTAEKTVIGSSQAKSMDQAVVLALHVVAQNIESKVQAISDYFTEVDSTAMAPEKHRDTSFSKVITSQNIAGIVIEGMVKSVEEGALPEENLPEEFTFEEAISVTFEQNDGGYYAKLYNSEEQKGDNITELQTWEHINSGGSYLTLLEHIQNHPQLTLKYASMWEETGFTYYVQLSYRVED